jgi:methyl-accepting chemotaxis protein
VAAEVRALAQRCAEAAHEVKGLISESQQRVEQGVDLVGRTGAALRRIIEKVGEIDALVGGIATSAKDQAINLEQVNGALAHMKGAIQQNAAMAQQTKVAVLGLDADAESLASLMGRFGGEDEGSSRPEAAAAA